MADSTPFLTSPSHLTSNRNRDYWRSVLSSVWRWVGVKEKDLVVVLAGPLAMVLVICFVTIAEGPLASRMLGAVVWLGIWWIFEPVPICITALLPVVLFPFLMIMEADEVASKYVNDTVMLMLGSFMLALAIERFNFHKRIALRILLFVGGEKMDPRLLLLGFCVGPGFVSMWMSNTAAAVMMIPMATGFLKHFEADDIAPILCNQCSRTFSRKFSRTKHVRAVHSYSVIEDADGDDIIDPEALAKQQKAGKEVDPAKVKKDFCRAVILGITYATAIGGLGTLTGCGPNLVLPGIYSQRFPEAPPVSYLQWMLFAVPLAVPFLIFEWLLLCWLFCPPTSVQVIEASLTRSMVEEEYEALGPMKFSEKFIAVEFVVLVILWCTRTLGNYPGWAVFFGDLPNEGTVSVMMGIILFLVPNKVVEGQKLLDWPTCKKLPWDVMLLLGGGFALSAGIHDSGLASSIAANMEVLDSVPYWLLTPVVSLIINITTEFSSNAATATLFLPLLAEVAVSIGWHPLLLMIPATFSCSFAFILPIATPPNAIAHATGYLRASDMFIPGLILKVVGIALLSVLTPTLGAVVYGLDKPAKDLPWITSIF